MRKLARLAAVTGVVASIGMAGPAQAANPICVGTQNTAGMCFWVTSGPGYSDCVYLGPPPCIPVHVPGVVVDCWGWIGDDAQIVCF